MFMIYFHTSFYMCGYSVLLVIAIKPAAKWISCNCHVVLHSTLERNYLNGSFSFFERYFTTNQS